MSKGPNVLSLQTPTRKRLRWLRIGGKTLLWVLFALILFVCGIVTGVYSPWFQDSLRQQLEKRLNADPDTHFRLGNFRLRFPLDLDVEDLLMTNHGDTVVSAASITAKVSLWPLVTGKVALDRAQLQRVAFQSGNTDSASCMNIKAEDLRVGRSTIRLSDMDIHISKVTADSLLFSMYTNPADTFPQPPPPSAPMRMNITVDRIDFTRLTFAMQMMPTIYNLTAKIAAGAVDSVGVNLTEQTVGVSKIDGHGLDAVYLMPDSTQIANTLVIKKESTTTTPPWTVRIGRLDMTDSRALYTTYGTTPLPGLDFAYIEVSDVGLHLTDFYNCGPRLRLPLAISATERCGLRLDVTGQLDIDSTRLDLRDFKLDTPTGTNMTFAGYMGLGGELSAPSTPLGIKTEGNLSVADVETMFPAFKPYFVGLRPGAAIENRIDINGTSGNLRIERADLRLDRHIMLAASGELANVFDPTKLSGHINLDSRITDVSTWTKELLAGTGVEIPALTVKGTFDMSGDTYRADLVAITGARLSGAGTSGAGLSGAGTSVPELANPGTTTTTTTTIPSGSGRIALKGSFAGRRQDYHLDLKASDFPVNAFMPRLGIGRLTASVRADGHGFDLFSPTTKADVAVNIADIRYLDKQYRDIALAATVGDDHADITVNSSSPGLDMHLNAQGEIVGDKYYWNIALQSSGLSLYDLGFAKEPSDLTADMVLKAGISKNLHDIDAGLAINSVRYTTTSATTTTTIALRDSRLLLSTNDSMTNVSAQNGDLYAYLSTPMPIDSIMDRMTAVSSEVDRQMKERRIYIPAIQQSLMPFSLDIEAGPVNALNELLGQKGMAFDNLSVVAANDTNIYLKAKATEVRFNKMKFDDVAFDITQLGNRLDYMARVDNRPGTFDKWAHVLLDGYFDTNKLAVNVEQKNIKGETGFDIGADLTINNDSTVTLHFASYNPTINYQPWTLNEDNFISFDFNHYHLDADLKMKSAMSRLALYTEHAKETDHQLHGSDEDLILQLFDIQLQDWLALDPFAPAIKGNLSAGLRLNWQDKTLNGSGTVDLANLYYGKEKVGDLNLDMNVHTNAAGLIDADAELWIDNNKALVVSGALNDSTRTSPLNLDVDVLHLPLVVANPFLPEIGSLSGAIDGHMTLTGDKEKHSLNGYLAFDNAALKVKMIGSTFTLNNDTIPVKDNLVTFKDFTIEGANENPLAIDGTIDINSLVSPQIDLSLNATNMQIVNTNRAPKGADVYGKAFIGLNSKVQGNLRKLDVKANLNVLPGTNVTYVLAGGTAAIQNQANTGMVKFVNFADTAAMAAADSVNLNKMQMNLNATLNIQTGSIISVDLGSNVQDRVQLQGSGTLNYVSSPIGAGRLTGRYTLSGGFIRYAPPLISNINFAFSEGSYVAFTGDIANPQFNIKAVEKMRANVSQAGQNSRLIYFDIILNVNGSLENFKFGLNLETDDDVTVANELASMSPTQRESEAINLLLYNTYTGGSTKATSNLNGNPLFSFLTNSVNSWLANNVRGVDLSIGVNQYDQTTNGATTTTTSYSYQVSKTLLNDRIKIVIGGSYSDDPAESGNVAENLINDISVEYYLNNSRTMYLKLFRHTGYESILEGEITQTGVGFVYKKRISRISDMFVPSRFRRPPSPTTTTEAPPTTTTTIPSGAGTSVPESTTESEHTGAEPTEAGASVPEPPTTTK